MKRDISASVFLLLILVSTSSAGSIRTRVTTEINGKGALKLVNFERMMRNPTIASPKIDFPPESESRADQADVMVATTIGSIMPANEEVFAMKDDTVDDTQPSTIPNLTEDTTDMAMPIWDSTKIETPKVQNESESASVEGDSLRNPGPQHSFVDRKKEAERLRKVVSAFHFNRVFGTTAAPSTALRAFPATSPAPSTRQRALGFPLLITNTLDNFHHQLDWSRFGAFSAELE
jgi:hypothetical protein